MQEGERKAVEEMLKVESQFKGGASWFYWIAGLSIVNSAALLSGSSWGFIVGLGITQVIDGLGLVIAEHIGAAGKATAFVLDIIVAGIFVLFGVFARKRYNWAFIVGMVLYGLDGLIFLLAGDVLSIAFHVFALYCIYNGLKAVKRIAEMERAVQMTGAQPGSVAGGEGMG